MLFSVGENRPLIVAATVAVSCQLSGSAPAPPPPKGFHRRNEPTAAEIE